MLIYIGLIVISPLKNNLKYESILKELKNLLYLHKNDLKISISDTLISFSELNGDSEITFPTNCLYFHTCYFKINNDKIIISDQKNNFVKIAWEALNIFIEYYPSKISIFQENLRFCLNYEEKLFENEIFRRQINLIKNKKDFNEKLNEEDLNDLLFLAKKSIKNEKNIDFLNLCLEIFISEQCDISILNILEEEKLIEFGKLIENELKDECIYSLYQTFYSKYINSLNKKENPIMIIERSTNENLENYSNIFQSKIINENIDFSNCRVMKSLIFKLKESTDIEKLALYLDFINRNINENNKIYLKKFKIHEVLDNIIIKYCKGEYDDSYINKYCFFHNRIIEYILFNDNEDFFFGFDFINKINQIIQEGILNLIENIQYNQEINQEFIVFMNFSLKLIDIYCKKNYFDSILETLTYGKNIIENYCFKKLKLKNLNCFGNDFSNFYENIIYYLELIINK